MVEPISSTAAIVVAIIGVISVLARSPWILLMGVVFFLYTVGFFVNIPQYMWIVLIVIVGLWILNQGKGK